MNDFFSHNGFSIVDRANFKDDEKTFGNVWGLCDEDLFKKALKAPIAERTKTTFESL